MPPSDEAYKADLSKRRGQVAAGISDPDDRKKFIAAQGEGKMSDADLEANTYRTRNELAAAPYSMARDAGKQ